MAPIQKYTQDVISLTVDVKYIVYINKAFNIDMGTSSIVVIGSYIGNSHVLKYPSLSDVDSYPPLSNLGIDFGKIKSIGQKV